MKKGTKKGTAKKVYSTSHIVKTKTGVFKTKPGIIKPF